VGPKSRYIEMRIIFMNTEYKYMMAAKSVTTGTGAARTAIMYQWEWI
jgi:hypothetical protein